MVSNPANRLYMHLRDRIFTALDAEAVAQLSVEQLRDQLKMAIDAMVERERLQAPSLLRTEFVNRLVDELRGLGPLQPLIDDDSISDIMVNGPQCVYVEQNGRLSLTDIKFLNEEQLLTIAKRIASQVGRRVDSLQPMCDARLPDGSRVNIAIPPISIDGTAISIRKFRKINIEFDDLIKFGTLSEQMAFMLQIASVCRLNIVISGGTGSGKTTLLNAMSRYISPEERIITIEDAAELRLQQPHVVRMETRIVSTENTGAIHQRELVINALRMRPDRIIIGECRGAEAFEMLQAMNTGHDGSMTSLHANSPRDAIGRLESMVLMSAPNLSLDTVRRNIASAIDIIIQVSRVHDGSRKIVAISEIIGVEGPNVVLEDLFRFEVNHSDRKSDGRISGQFLTNGLISRSRLKEKARFFNLEAQLDNVFQRAMS